MSERHVLVYAALAVVAVVSGPARGHGQSFLGDTGADLVYTPVAPCRIVDTRVAGGPIAANTQRSFQVTGSTGFDAQGGNLAGCAIPSGATAVMANLVAVSPAGAGNLRAWPFGQAVPFAAVINYAAVPGLAIANGLTLPICDPAVSVCSLDLAVQADVSATHLVVDVYGFLQRVAPLSVTTGLLDDGAVTAAKLDGDSVDETKIVDGSVGAAEVDAAEVQRRVTGACAPGSSVRVINADGTVGCESDDAGGGITSLTAGTGLTGGTITTTGTIAVDFAGPGSANTAARSDHTHTAPVVTRTRTIAANTCGLNRAPSPVTDTGSCFGAGMLRTAGDTEFPCMVHARTSRDTYLCTLDLPADAQITSVTAHAYDVANDGYVEALLWRVDATTLVGHDLFTDFAGTWQSSGTAFSGGQTSFPLFSAATPHTVSGNHQYLIGFALRSPTGQALFAEGFRVTYTTQ
jgi:hypothetical protein